MPFFPLPLDLHQLQPAIPPGGLLRVRPAAHDDGRRALGCRERTHRRASSRATASRRSRFRIPVNARCAPDEVRRTPAWRLPAGCGARRSARRRSRSASAAHRYSDARSPSGDRCTGRRRTSVGGSARPARPSRASPAAGPTWYTSSRACHFGRRPARKSLGTIDTVQRVGGDAAVLRCWRAIPKSPSFRRCPWHTNTSSG